MALRMAIAALFLLLWAAPGAAGAGEPLGDAGYLAFADRVAAGLEPRWDEAAGGYLSRDKGATARTNANMLIVHAGAALARRTGPARHDDRAARIVAAMTRPPMLAITRREPGAQPQPLLAQAPRRRRARPRVARLADRRGARVGVARPPGARAARPGSPRPRGRPSTRCAHHRQWRFPDALKNQINWNAQLYASAARMTGDGRLLRGDYRRHLVRFVRGARRPLHGMRTTNLGAGLGFHYSPELDEARPLNFDTPEYSHIVATTLLYHREARAAGMRALPAADVALLTRWTTRLLLGNWTHAGYLNWDTGYGLHRLHSGQYWAWSMQGLLTIATAEEFAARPEHPRWAKALFDRGLRLYARWADAAGRAARAAAAVRHGLRPPRPRPLREPDGGERRARDPARPRPRAVHRPAAVLRLRPRAPAPRRLHAVVLDGGRPPHARRLPVRRHRARPAARPARRRRGHHGRRPARHVRRRGPRRGRSRRARLAARPAARREPAPGARARALGLVQGADRDRGDPRGARARDHDAHVPPGVDRRALGRPLPGGGCAGYDVDVLLPTWGETATRERPHARARRSPSRARARRRSRSRASAGSSWARRRSRATPSPRCGRDAGALLVPSAAPRPQRTVPHPGPGVAVRILEDGRLTHATLSATLRPRGLPD